MSIHPFVVFPQPNGPCRIVDSSRLSQHLATPASPSREQPRVHRLTSTVTTRHKLPSGQLSSPVRSTRVVTTAHGALTAEHHQQHAAAVEKVKASHAEPLSAAPTKSSKSAARPATRAAAAQPAPAKQQQQQQPQPAAKKRGFIANIRGKSQGFQAFSGRALSSPRSQQRQRVLKQRSAHIRR